VTVTLNGRTADHDINPMFLHRFSPRAFSGEVIPDDVLMTMFEAARWAPSAFNVQPWRFVYAKRDTPQWSTLFDSLIEYNRLWAAGASALAFIISDRFRRKDGAAPQENYSHSFDAGAAWGYLALQARDLGWIAHGMTGFDHVGTYEALGVPSSDYRIEAAIAIGRHADKSGLPEMFHGGETPNSRRAVGEFVFEGKFGG
jgi:nitroreductase